MRCFCGFRWSCYGEGAGKSRQANGSDRDGALDVGHFDVNAREARRGRYRSLLAPLASLLVALTLVACGHILLPPPTQTAPAIRPAKQSHLLFRGTGVVYGRLRRHDPVHE